MAKKKICIIIGHGPNDSGAVNDKSGQTEYLYNTKLAQILMQTLSVDYEIVSYNRGTLKVENIAILNSYKADIFISLHANSANNNATGTEALYWYSSEKSKKLAEMLSANISKLLGLKNRGAKPRITQELKAKNISKFKNMETRGSYLLQKTNAPCVIIEPFFISNDTDLAIAESKINEYAETIKSTLEQYFKEMI